MAGAVVIDNTVDVPARRRRPARRPGDQRRARSSAGDRILPVANCTAIVLTMALAPIARTAGLRSVNVATYQAASGAGRPGLEELAAGERALQRGEPEPAPHTFAAPIWRAT